MKKLKDLLYDYNDVIIAFAILVIAALLIIWRIDVILDYPEKILENNTPQVEAPVVDEDEDKDKDSDEDKDTDKDKDEDQGAAEAPLWADGKLTRDVKVTIDSSAATATQAIQCLVDAGLFESYSDYQSVCTDMGINHESVSAGTFTFKAGSTKKDIADAVNWS